MLIRIERNTALIAILRINGVQAAGGTKLRINIVARALIIHAQQQGMIQRAGGEFRLRLGIDGELIQLLLRYGGTARNRLRGGVEAVAVNAAIVGAQIGVAQVLAHRPGVVEAVLGVVAHHFGVARNFVALLAFVEIGRQFVLAAVRARNRHHRALTRQPAVVAGLRLVLEIGQQVETGIGVRAPAKRGRDGIALLFVTLLLRIGAAREAGQTVAVDAVVIQRAAKIESSREEIVAAHLKLHFAQGFLGRALAHQRHHAAGIALAVKHRNRAAQ